MERAVWVRGGMVTSVLVLGVLILVTPILLGRPTSELSSLPMLIVGWSGNQSYLIVYATGALQQYQYKLIRLAFNESISSVNGTFRDPVSVYPPKDFRWSIPPRGTLP
ncbi:MAG: hypothetical protein E6K08_00405 [Methanobacteriota archaeon]|nr:MAG: hypothetical protein E6K08_00405 [Euryarchaeota archaeon]